MEVVSGADGAVASLGVVERFSCLLAAGLMLFAFSFFYSICLLINAVSLTDYVPDLA